MTEAVIVTREDALKFLGNACRNWRRMPTLSEDDVQDVASALGHFVKALQSARPVASEGAVAAALDERNEYLVQLGGCGDGHCIVVKPKGMHTNGGCRCWRDGFKMQRYAYANNKFAAAIATLQHKVADHG